MIDPQQLADARLPTAEVLRCYRRGDVAGINAVLSRPELVGGGIVVQLCELVLTLAKASDFSPETLIDGLEFAAITLPDFPQEYTAP